MVNRTDLKAANQRRTNSNDQPETPVISKHPENARFGADFCPRFRAFAGYDKDSQSERATSAHVNRIRRFSQNSQVFSQPLHLFGQMVSLFRAGGEFRHFFVVHQRRFVKYRLLQDGSILKVTTNHIERVWVDLRKILRGVPKEEIRRRLNEVPSRLMTFVPG